MSLPSEPRSVFDDPLFGAVKFAGILYALAGAVSLVSSKVFEFWFIAGHGVPIAIGSAET